MPLVYYRGGARWKKMPEPHISDLIEKIRKDDMLSNAMMKECPISQPNMNKVRQEDCLNISRINQVIPLSGFLQPVA